jgi:hypothetical protein
MFGRQIQISLKPVKHIRALKNHSPFSTFPFSNKYIYLSILGISMCIYSLKKIDRTPEIIAPTPRMGGNTHT